MMSKYTKTGRKKEMERLRPHSKRQRSSNNFLKPKRQWNLEIVKDGWF